MGLLADKLGENSTWIGLLAIVASIGGYVFSDALTAAIAALGTGAVGLYLVIMKERNK